MGEFDSATDNLGAHYANLPQRHNSNLKALPFRFWANVDRSSGDCWLWTAGLSEGDRGYGLIGSPVGTDHAHRVSWVMENGPIPVGMHVLHTCDNPSCVRPDHLWLGTNDDNIIDRIRKGRKTGRRPGQVHKDHKHCSCFERLQADNLRLIALAESYQREAGL